MKIPEDVSRTGRCHESIRGGFRVGLLLAFVLPVLAGCGSGALRPQLGAISVTDPNAKPPVQLTSVAINGKASVMVSVANDSKNLGVNWIAICGGSPLSPPAANPCGTISPTYAASAAPVIYSAPAFIPVGGTVTLVASSASDPSVTSSIVLTIAPLPITVTLTMPPPPSVGVGAVVLLSATVTNDPLAAGLNWTATCAATNCGTLKSTLPIPTQTASGGQIVYTAPATIPAGGIAVTIQATSLADPTKFANAILTVGPVAITVDRPSASAQVGGGAMLTATVVNDSANRGADWTLMCANAGGCGTITAHTSSGQPAVYSAAPSLPAGAVVTAIATATADSTKTATANITLVPAISIVFAPTPGTTLTAGTTASFTALVANDLNGAGVDFTVTCTTATCGTFSANHAASGVSVTYTEPIGSPAGTVTITATSTSSTAALPVRSVSASLTVLPVIGVNFVPYAPSQVPQSDSTILNPPPISLLAAVTNDATNAGIDWSVCTTVATCGQFQVSPAIAANATTPAVNASYAATVHTANGQAALYVPPPAPPPNGGTVAVTVKAHNPAATSPAAAQVASIRVVSTPLGVALSGRVMAGTQPVTAAAIYLYAAGTSGYSSAATPLTGTGTANNVATSATGQFSIPAGYACPAQSSQVYLVALGGNAGAGINPNLAMLTALGPCGALSSNVNYMVNEVTTVASTWPLASFMTDYAHLGSSAANATSGLANAAATVNNLVDVTTGIALAQTPFGNGTVPRAEIDTLASILNTCTVTTGGAVGDGSKCGQLFGATNPGALSSTAPTNTAQAALNIAQAPSFNTTPGVGSIYSLLPPTPAVPPVLATAPNDWTISLNFSGGGLSTRSAASALAVDANGAIWITNLRFSSVTQFTNLGAPLSPTGTGNVQATAGGYQGAGITFPAALTIDLLGNAWVANSGSLSEVPFTTALNYNGSLAGSAYTGGGLGSQIKGIAADGSGNLWLPSSGSPGALSWFAGANASVNGTAVPPGTALSPATGFTQGINNPSGAIGIDTAGTVWLLNSGNNTAAEYASASGSFLQTDYGYTQVTPTPINSVLAPGVGNALAIDNPGNVYLSPGSQLVKLIAGGSQSTFGGLGSASTALGVNYSQFLALDGLSRAWLLITGGSTNCISAYSLAELSSAGSQLNVNATGCGYLSTGVNPTDVGIAVDSAGSVWVLNGSSLTQFVGVAAPVVTPFSVGVAKKTLDQRP